MNREEAEKLLHREEDRRNTIMHDLNFIVALLGVLIGVMYFYISSYLSDIKGIPLMSQTHAFMYCLLLSLLVISAWMMVASVWLIILTFIKNKYDYYPTSTKLNEHYQELLDHYNGIERLARYAYNDDLKNLAIEAKDFNQNINQIRKKYTQKSVRFLFGALLILFVAIIPFFYLPRETSSSVMIESFSDTLQINNTSLPSPVFNVIVERDFDD